MKAVITTNKGDKITIAPTEDSKKSKTALLKSARTLVKVIGLKIGNYKIKIK